MKLLYVNCCISLHAPARTEQLADAFLTSWQAAHPSGEIETVDLRAMAVLPLTAENLAAYETKLGEGRIEAPEFALARQFAAADRIVIAAPYWELSYPAQLRLYIERISALGIAFAYNDKGESVGLCKAEKLLFLTTAGGSLSNANYGSDHLCALSRMYGIPQYEFLGADLQDVQEIDHESILRQTIERARELALTF